MPQSGSPTPAAGPRYAAGWAAAVYALATMALGYPALTGGFLVSQDSDQYIGGYAVREFGTTMLRQTRHFPLWNPYLFSGMPYVASMNGDIFYPPSVLARLTLRPDVAVTWLFIIHIFLAGWLTYLFLRTVRLGFAGSLAGGLAYMMGGPIASYVSPGHDGKLYVSALLPLALLLLVRGIRDGRRGSWPALAATIGLAILTPHPQLLQYMLLAAGAYALFLAFWSDPAVRPPRPIAVRRLGLALASVALGLAMGAIQFLPVAQYVPWSPRSGGGHGGYAFVTSFAMPPEELINTYLPQFSGILDQYWGRNIFHFHSEYLGAVVLMLAGCAFIGSPAARRRHIWFWLAVAVVATLWTLGNYTPFFYLVYTLVPGTKYFRAPSTMFFLAALAAAVLAGEGLENVLRGKVGALYPTVWTAVAAFVALLAAGGALTTIALGIADPGRSDLVADNATSVTTGALRSLLFVALTAAVIVLRRREVMSARLASPMLIILLGADLWSVERQYWRFSPPASVLYASDPAVDYVRRQPQPGRVLALALSAGATVRDPELFGDALMIHRVRSALGYHGNEIGRYDVLTGKADGYRPIFTQQLWRLLNIQYLLCDLASLPIAGSRLVVGPVRDAAGSTVYLYRLPGDNPAAWVTPVSVKVGDDQALATVRDQRFDPTVAAIFDTSAAVVGQQVTTLPAPLGIAVTTTRDDPGHMTYRLDRPAPGGASLIASENYYPGWTATADGKPATVGRADFTLIGVALPAGTSTVDLRFESPVFQAGAAITLAAVAAAFLWWTGSLVVGRRRHG